MIRTLRTYLVKDLLRVTALATVVLTLVITVFAIIEPLRERGLNSAQAAALFGYFVPAMLSLTLPIAALFAATMVYGRFSQDNELLACRASGISTLAILRPAMWLGAGVSLATLGLALFVAPWLLSASQRELGGGNLKQIAYHQLESRRRFKLEDMIFRADRVDADSGWLGGVVVAEVSDPADGKFFVASRARPDFELRDGRWYVSFNADDPVFVRQGGGMQVGARERQRLGYGRIPGFFEDRPRLYDLTRLYRTLQDPLECPAVRDRIEQIRQEVIVHEFYKDLEAAIRRKGPGGGRYTFEEAASDAGGGRIHRAMVEATRIRPGPRGGVILTAGDGEAVTVRQLRGPAEERSFRARRVKVVARWDPIRERAMVVLELGDVDIGESLHRQKESLGPFAVPRRIVRKGDVTLERLYESPQRYTGGGRAGKLIEKLDKHILPRLLAKVRAEMHQRWAYGIGCMLMVMLGAGLGLALRGGQVLAAFAISAVPGAAVNVLLVMGKQLIANVQAGSELTGICVIWGAVALLGGVTACLYAGPLRRGLRG